MNTGQAEMALSTFLCNNFFFFSVSLTLACEQVVQKEPRINEWIQLLFQSCSTCENGVIVKVFEGGESPVEVGLRLA